MKTAKNKLVVISPVQVNGALPVHLAVFSSVLLYGHTIPSHQLSSLTTSSYYSALTERAAATVTKQHLRI